MLFPLLQIQRQQPLQHLIIGQAIRLAVSREDGLVEFLMRGSSSVWRGL